MSSLLSKVALTQLKKKNSLKCCKVRVWAAHTVHRQQMFCHKISIGLLQSPWCGGSPPVWDEEFLGPPLWSAHLIHDSNLWPKCSRVIAQCWSLFFLWVCAVNLSFSLGISCNLLLKAGQQISFFFCNSLSWCCVTVPASFYTAGIKGQ